MPDWRKHLITALQRPLPAQLIIRIPLKNIRRGYFAHVIHPDDAFPCDGALHGFISRSDFGSKTSFHRAARAQMPGEGASVDTLHAWNFPASQLLIYRFFGSAISWDFAQLFDNEPAHMRMSTFLIDRVRAVVSD